MSRIAIICVCCGKELRNGLDTFGNNDAPMCWDCYSALQGEAGCNQYYGLAPHHHDLSITGTMIGSTVFDPLPEPNADGEYVIGEQIFYPDPQASGMGVWVDRVIPGWR